MMAPRAGRGSDDTRAPPPPPPPSPRPRAPAALQRRPPIPRRRPPAPEAADVLAFILRRLLLMVPTTLGIALVVFSLPPRAGGSGDGDDGGSGGEHGRGRRRRVALDKFRRDNGLDRSFVVQFLDYVGPFNLSATATRGSRRRAPSARWRWSRSPSRRSPTREVAEGRPVAIEHLYVTTEERDDWTAGSARSRTRPSTPRSATGPRPSSSRATTSEAARDKALARVFQCLFEQRLAARARRSSAASTRSSPR